MSGADFVRADLHVHTHPDGEADPKPDFDQYIDAAVANDIGILAITDHNRCDFVRDAMKAAAGKGIFLIPGVEISTHDGHLLALFDPNQVDRLESLCVPDNLKLTKLSETERRSSRSMLDLVQEIHSRGGLAIPAHVDASKGAGERLEAAQWIELLQSPALAGLEFSTKEALDTWFTETDTDNGRLEAWKTRQKDPLLKDRGLARLMSSDAHSPTQVGRDRRSRTLTRLRLDEPTFSSIRNAIAYNPKARCKAEVILPATYPRILSAAFEGGFLDGVEIDFSGNLNCLIGGRGSGKSTALLSIRAALGARVSEDEDINDPDRMPTSTTVRFIDAAGSERVAVRKRGEEPTDPGGAPIRLRLAELGQEETGRLARGYTAEPHILLEFLDGFLVRHHYDEREAELLAQLEENGAEVRRTSGIAGQIKKQEAEEQRLTASLQAATEGRVEELAKWATILASQGPMLEELERRIDVATTPQDLDEDLSLDAVASEFGFDLSTKNASSHADGDTGLRTLLEKFGEKRASVAAKGAEELKAAAEDVRASLAKWTAEQTDLQGRLKKKQSELEAQGLKVQAGAITTIANRLNEVKRNLTNLRKGQDAHRTALGERKKLLDELRANREKLFLERKAVMKRIAAAANSYADDLTIRVSFTQAGNRGEWRTWLNGHFGFRSPRVGRLAAKLSPAELAENIRTAAGREKLLQLKDADGNPFFSADQLDANTVGGWAGVFELETMRLPDLPKIEVQRPGDPERHAFNHLSAGQQRSVLLGLLLCAERSEPLVLDQPEDHLDGQYIASSVVSHLEAAKERRQIIIATHSANLTVLGDAELVIPMVVDDGKGRPEEAGAVDRPATRDQVCSLLEGGVVAYKKRGERYGLTFDDGSA